MQVPKEYRQAAMHILTATRNLWPRCRVDLKAKETLLPPTPTFTSRRETINIFYLIVLIATACQHAGRR
jgi:hypothetical protein